MAKRIQSGYHSDIKQTNFKEGHNFTVAKSKKVLPSFDVNDKVKWIGKDYMSGVVTEVQDQTVTVKFSFGTSKVKKISLERTE